MTSADLPEALLGALYQGVLEDPPWRSFLEIFCEAMGADSTTILIDQGSRDRPSALFVHGGIEPGLSRYKAEAFAWDPFVGLQPGTVTTFDEHIANGAQGHGDFIREFLTETRMRYLLGVDFRDATGLHVRLRVLRKHGRSDFVTREKNLVSRMLPHFIAAVHHFIHVMDIEVERDLYGNVLDRLSIGAILVTDEGRVIETNDVAGRLLNAGTGLKLVNGFLKLGTPKASRELNLQIERNAMATEEEAPPLKVLHIERAGKGNLNLFVRPVPRSARFEVPVRATAVAIITNPRRSLALSPVSLIQLFGLTSAEAALAVELATGGDLKEASLALGISHHTARTQVRCIFTKTDTRRQSELIGLLARSAAELT